MQANAVLTISYIITTVSDIPTGAFADEIGRTRSFLIGNLVRGAGWALYFATSTFWFFVLADSTAALGFTFANGALEAWAVDSLDKAGFTGSKTALFSRVAQLSSFAAMFGAIIGAYLARQYLPLPWAAGALMLTITAIAGNFLMNSPFSRHNRIVLSQLSQKVGARLTKGLAIASKSHTVSLLAFARAIQIGVWAPLEMEWQKYFMDSLGIKISTIGWFFCIFRIANILGAELTLRLAPDESHRPHLAASATLLSAASVAMAGHFVRSPVMVLLLLAGANATIGFTGPLIRTWANERIDASHRATLLSFFSTWSTIGGALGLLAGGAMADSLGLNLAWQVGGLTMILSAVGVLAAAYADSQEEARLARRIS